MNNLYKKKLYEEYSIAKKLVRGMLQTCFEHEEKFKNDLLKVRWKNEDYEITGLHISSFRVKVELTFEDSSTYNTFLELDDVFEWSLEV